MFAFRRLWLVVRHLLGRTRRDRDLDAELQSYLDLRGDELRRRGMPPEAAARRARIDLGGVAPVTEAVRAVRTGAALDRTWQDVRYALRGLRRSRGFAAAAIGTLALGVGANLAVFAVVDAAVFKPLPYAEAERLVEIERVVNRGRANQSRESQLPWEHVDAWRSESRLFDMAAALRWPGSAKVGDGDSAESTTIGRLSPELLRMLGVRPQIGRWFAPEDLADGSPVVLLTDTYWRTRLGAVRDVVGATLAINGRPHTIVGVMPAQFAWRVEAPVWPVSVAGWVPLDEFQERTQSKVQTVSTIFRLRPGLSLGDARRQLGAAAARHATAAGVSVPDDVELAPLDDRRMLTDSNMALFALLGAVGLLVLIACANVANLVVARSISRQREFSLRGALGASRGRLVRQTITESLVLATIAGGAAVVFAALSRGLLVALVPAELGLFRANPAAIDGRAVAACAVLVLLATVISALPSALRTRRTDLGVLLAGSERSIGTSGVGRAALAVLQSTQVALTVVLLAGCMLLAASFVRLVRTDLGFDPDGLAYLSLDLPRDRYPTAAAEDAFRDRLLAELRRAPSIESAAYAMSPPTGAIGNLLLRDDASEPVSTGASSDEGPLIRILLTDPAGFDLIGQRVVAGRSFNAADTTTSPPVAIVDEESAARLYPGESPIGKEIRYRRAGPWLTIVGVVSRVQPRRFTVRDNRIDVYRPFAQRDFAQGAAPLLLRDRDGDTARALAAARSVVRVLDPAIDVPAGGAVANQYAWNYDSPRFYTTLMSLFAGLALATAGVGLSGLLNFSVVRRRHEIGVRVALGASPGGVRAMILRDAIAPVLVGAAAGLVAALWLSRYLASMLYEITPSHPVSYVAAVGVLGATALLAAWAPARRATRLDPSTTLRE
jgi:predicted permease